MAIGNGQISTPIFGTPGLTTGAPAVPTAVQPPWSGSGTFPLGSTAFPFVSREFAGGLSAPELLAAIAMHQGQPQGPTNDQEVEDFIYDVLEVLPGATDVEVRCEGGTRVALRERAAQTPQARRRSNCVGHSWFAQHTRTT